MKFYDDVLELSLLLILPSLLNIFQVFLNSLDGDISFEMKNGGALNKEMRKKTQGSLSQS